MNFEWKSFFKFFFGVNAIVNFFKNVKIIYKIILFLIVLCVWVMHSLHTNPMSLSDLLKTDLYKPYPIFQTVLKHKSAFYNENEYTNEVVHKVEKEFDKSLINLLKYAREHNIKFDLIYVVNQDCPSYAFRMNGSFVKDSIILNQLNNPTNQESRKKKYNEIAAYRDYNPNAKFYNLYTNQNCDNIDLFYEYTMKHSDQIKGILRSKTPNLAKGSYWFLIERTEDKKIIHFFTQVATQHENHTIKSKISYLSYIKLNDINELHDRYALITLLKDELHIAF